MRPVHDGNDASLFKRSAYFWILEFEVRKVISPFQLLETISDDGYNSFCLFSQLSGKKMCFLRSKIYDPLGFAGFCCGL